MAGHFWVAGQGLTCGLNGTHGLNARPELHWVIAPFSTSTGFILNVPAITQWTDQWKRHLPSPLAASTDKSWMHGIGQASGLREAFLQVRASILTSCSIGVKAFHCTSVYPNCADGTFPLPRGNRTDADRGVPNLIFFRSRVASYSSEVKVGLHLLTRPCKSMNAWRWSLIRKRKRHLQSCSNNEGKIQLHAV